MTVLQKWLEYIPLRMQSTLLLSLRGPDTHACPNIKKIQRWMRGVTFKPGNPENYLEFMNHEYNLPDLTEKGELAKELEFCTQHFYSHLAHGLEVLAYKHPNSSVAIKARNYFFKLCALMHMPPEGVFEFEDRLQELEWPDGQPENFEEARLKMGGA